MKPGDTVYVLERGWRDDSDEGSEPIMIFTTKAVAIGWVQAWMDNCGATGRRRHFFDGDLTERWYHDSPADGGVNGHAYLYRRTVK